MTTADWTSEARGTARYADVNGLHLYYETHGSGRPLILLHGGLGSGEMFGPVLPALSATRQVIAVDLQGHGRTADIDRPLDIRLMADDIAALIGHLGLERPDLLGYSLGGGVALMSAVKYPDLISRIVVVSAHIAREAIYADMLGQQGQVSASAADFMKDTPMYQLYQRVAPRPGDFPRLLDKIGASMAKDFDFTEEVRGIRVPTMFVAADADMAPPSHYVEVFKLLDAASGTVAGSARAGRPAATRWRSCPASPTTTSSAHRSWRLRPSPSWMRRERSGVQQTPAAPVPTGDRAMARHRMPSAAA